MCLTTSESVTPKTPETINEQRANSNMPSKAENAAQTPRSTGNEDLNGGSFAAAETAFLGPCGVPTQMPNDTTIAAVATARGAGGIAIVRASGTAAEAILKGAFEPAKKTSAFESHRMMYGRVKAQDRTTIDECMAVLMRAPNSYTREDVIEIQCHGGDVAAQRTLARVIELGARIAEPGEFTKRAFLNGRIDLSRAEAVMQLIGASSEAAARASIRQLEGGVSGFVRDVSAKIMDQLALIEASTDFPDEVEEETASAQVAEAVREIIAQIDRRCDPRAARLIRDGASIVLAGRPNVGKSSLMNALLNQERAIVTSIPGTTRDVLTERIVIGGITAELSDTAGRRDTLDPVEKIGVDRARQAVEQADVVLIVLDVSEPLSDEDRELLTQADARTIICLNKNDLPATLDRSILPSDVEVVELSASVGQGVDELMRRLEQRLVDSVSEDKLTVERHLLQARLAKQALESALVALDSWMPLDVVAIDLKSALAALAEITAQNPTESLITTIFSRFCVGK